MSKNALPAERIDEIPLAPSAFKARVVALATLALLLLAWPVKVHGAAVLEAYLSKPTTTQESRFYKP